MTRRALLAGGALAAGAGTLVCAGLAPLPDAGSGLRVLSTEEAEIVEALADALWPEGNAIGIEAQDLGMADRVDQLFAEVMGQQSVTASRQVLRGLAAWPGFSGLDVAERLRKLQDWTGPDELLSRVAVDGVKAVLGLAYFNAPEVLSALGYRSFCHGE